MYVYLAEPGDFATGEWDNAVATVVSRIKRLGHLVYRPVAAWDLSLSSGANDVDNAASSADLAQLDQINRHALDAADLVVAVLPPNTRTLGVPMEIGWATDRGKLVVALADPATTGKSTLLRGNPLVRIIKTPDQIDGALADAVNRGLTQAKSLKFALDRGHPGYPVGLTRHYSSDAGLDLYTAEQVELAESQFTMIPCGVRLELPSDVFGWIVARSSTFPKWGIIVPPGVIDSGFRGELTVPAYRAPSWEVQGPGQPNGNGRTKSGPAELRDFVPVHTIPAGTRLAQLILLPNVAASYDPKLVEVVEPADRGSAGFGSTGSGRVVERR